MQKISSKYKKYIRLGIGILILALGLVFMLFPFIPLGYVFVIAGVFLLAFEIPPLKKLVNKIKEKDDKGRVEKVEQEIERGDQYISKRFVKDDGQDSTRQN